MGEILELQRLSLQNLFVDFKFYLTRNFPHRLGAVVAEPQGTIRSRINGLNISNFNRLPIFEPVLHKAKDVVVHGRPANLKNESNPD